MHDQRPQPGVCRFCGCTDVLPCFNLSTQRACAWLEGTDRTVCDSPLCVEQWEAFIDGAAAHPTRLT